MSDRPSPTETESSTPAAEAPPPTATDEATARRTADSADADSGEAAAGPSPPAEGGAAAEGGGVEGGATAEVAETEPPADTAGESEVEGGEARAEGDPEAADEESGGAAEPPRKGLTPPQLEPLEEARVEARPIEGKVIGWNQGGFHVVLDAVPAFCPRSEMEVGRPKAPKSYLDKTFPFLILRIEEEGRRVVLSRAAVLRHERAQKRKELRKKIRPGAVLTGRVASLTDFGAFVDVGGVQGLVHVSEISRQRVRKPADVLTMGQHVEVKVLKVEQGGRRISLSMKALEPDPWNEIRSRFSEGSVVEGTIEKVASFGAFVELESGLTGLLPASTVTMPRGTSLARMFPPGKKIAVQIMSVDPRRRRISLALEGSSLEGSRADFESYKKHQQQAEESGGFNALAAALRKVREPDS